MIVLTVQNKFSFKKRRGIIHIGAGVLFLLIIVGLITISIVSPELFNDILNSIEKIIEAFTPN